MKPKNGTVVSRNGVEFEYRDGTWYPTKDKGWTANEKIAAELMQKWSMGDYKIWDNKANGYVKGEAPVTGGVGASATGSALLKDSEKRAAEDVKKGGEFRLGIQDKQVPEAAKAIEQKAVAGAGISGSKPTKTALREAQTETGVNPVKANLTGGNTTATTPLAKASMGDFFEPNTPIEKYNDVGLKGLVKDGISNIKNADLGAAAEYLPDVFKGVLGLYGASQKLPQFETPQYFTDYERKLKELSTQGLTDAEMATAKRDLDRTYAYDVNNIERFAGGRSGVALANLGRATDTFQQNTNALNVADAQMQRQNLAQYGNVVGTHLGLDQNIFQQKYNEAAQSKMAGAQLAADAFSNIQSRADYNQAYGKGSVYDKYQTSLLQGQQYLNDILKYQQEEGIALPDFNPQTINPNAQIPQYMSMYGLGGK